MSSPKIYLHEQDSYFAAIVEADNGTFSLCGKTRREALSRLGIYLDMAAENAEGIAIDAINKEMP